MLSQLIGQRRARVLDRWRERTLASYPAETARFLSAEKDGFANPVGLALVEGTGATLAGLLEGRPPEEVAAALAGLIRIRAVQGYTPAQAVGFVLELKDVLREELADRLQSPRAVAELAAIERWVDRLLLGAFDLYASCREQVLTIRVNEIRGRSLRVMERFDRWRERRDLAADEPMVEPGR